MKQQFDERQLIKEFKESNWVGVAIPKVSPSITLRKTLAKFPKQPANLCARGEIIHIDHEEHTLLKEALTEYGLAAAFDAIWPIEHSWGLETYFGNTLWELMDELSMRCSENFKYERIWEISRDFMNLLAKKTNYNRVTFVYGNVMPCWCGPCKSELNIMGRIKTLRNIVWGKLLCLR